jgi:hypothetical protein
LPEKEAEDVCVFLDGLADGAASGVTRLRIVEKEDGTV